MTEAGLLTPPCAATPYIAEVSRSQWTWSPTWPWSDCKGVSGHFPFDASIWFGNSVLEVPLWSLEFVRSVLWENFTGKLTSSHDQGSGAFGKWEFPSSGHLFVPTDSRRLSTSAGIWPCGCWGPSAIKVGDSHIVFRLYSPNHNRREFKAKTLSKNGDQHDSSWIGWMKADGGHGGWISQSGLWRTSEKYSPSEGLDSKPSEFHLVCRAIARCV